MSPYSLASSRSIAILTSSEYSCPPRPRNSPSKGLEPVLATCVTITLTAMAVVSPLRAKTLSARFFTSSSIVVWSSAIALDSHSHVLIYGKTMQIHTIIWLHS